MTEKRMVAILAHVSMYGEFPAWATLRELHQLRDRIELPDSWLGADAYLTSLGEMDLLEEDWSQRKLRSWIQVGYGVRAGAAQKSGGSDASD